MPQLTNQHKNIYNSATLKNVELKYDLVVMKVILDKHKDLTVLDEI